MTAKARSQDFAPVLLSLASLSMPMTKAWAQEPQQTLVSPVVQLQGKPNKGVTPSEEKKLTEIVAQVSQQLRTAFAGKVEVVHGQSGPFTTLSLKVEFVTREFPKDTAPESLRTLENHLVVNLSPNSMKDLLEHGQNAVILEVKNDPIARAVSLGLLAPAGTVKPGSSFGRERRGSDVFRAEMGGLPQYRITVGEGAGCELFDTNGGHRTVRIAQDSYVDPAPYTVMVPNPAREQKQQRLNDCQGQVNKFTEENHQREAARLVPIFGDVVIAHGQKLLNEAVVSRDAALNDLNATPAQLPEQRDPPPYVDFTNKLVTFQQMAASENRTLQKLLEDERKALSGQDRNAPEAVLLLRLVQRLIEGQNSQQLAQAAEKFISDPQLKGLVMQLGANKGIDPSATYLKVSQFIRELAQGISSANAGLVRDALRDSYAKEQNPEVRKTRMLDLAIYDVIAQQVETSRFAPFIPWDRIPLSIPALDIFERVIPAYVQSL